MLQIAICDDCPQELSSIRAAAEHYFARHCDYSAAISEYGTPLLFMEDLPRNGGFDILLLDICMPGILGTEIAREIRKRRDTTEIIFLTTSKEFAVDAFALKAAHYLVKPFSQVQLDEAMDRALARIADCAPKKLTFKTAGGELRTVDVNTIQYIERCAHWKTLHMDRGEVLESSFPLSRLLQELDRLSPGQFIAPFKGYLVNQKAIATIEVKRILLRCGAAIPIPRGSFREIQAKYFAYLFGGGRQCEEAPETSRNKEGWFL